MRQLHDLYEELSRDGVVFCFSGPTSQSVVEGIGQVLRRKMEMEQASMTTIQRVFSLFVEQMQNIVNYSIEQTRPAPPAGGSPEEGGRDDLRHGVVVVGRCRDRFYVICGNKVRASQGEKMLQSVRSLRAMKKQELKEHYKRMRRRDAEGDSKGAGLGLIEMFRRASEPPECHLAAIDDDTVFFSIKAIG